MDITARLWTSRHVYVHHGTNMYTAAPETFSFSVSAYGSFTNLKSKYFPGALKKNQFSESAVARGSGGELTALPQQLLERLNSASQRWLQRPFRGR